MFRFFDDKKERRSTTSASWLDTLTSAAGWLNPFNLDKNTLRNVYLTSLTFLSVIPRAVGQSYNDGRNHRFVTVFYDRFFPPNIDSHDHVANLFYSGIDHPSCSFGCDLKAVFEPIQEVLIKNCNLSDWVYLSPISVWSPYPSLHSVFLGQGMIGSRFELVYNTIDQCVIDTLKQHIPDSFGTVKDVALVVGIPAGLLIGGGIAFYIYRSCKSRPALANQNVNVAPVRLPPEPLEETRLIMSAMR